MTLEAEAAPTDAAPYRPSAGDRFGLGLFIVIGVGAAVVTVINSILRIVQVLGREDVPVSAGFLSTEVEAPIGPGQAPYPVSLDTATVTPARLPDEVVFPALASPIVAIIAITATMLALALLARSIMRGRIFSRRNTVLVHIAGVSALFGSAVATWFQNIAGSEMLHAVSEGSHNSYFLFRVEPALTVTIFFIYGIMASVFTVGARMQRDTEGLV